jgi:hypothetical protein
VPAAQGRSLEGGSEPLGAAQSEVKRACNLLITPTPEALNHCQDALARAVSALTEFRSQCEEVPAGSAVMAMACALRVEVLRARRLLENLASFYRGWERIFGTMSAGYTAGGDPAPVARKGRLCCRG